MTEVIKPIFEENEAISIGQEKGKARVITVRKTYKFRLYPNKKQQERLETVLDICRWLYNSALQERRDNYKQWQRYQVGPKPQISYYTQSKELTEMKDDLPELKLVYDKILRDVLIRLDKTFEAFFRRLKNKEKPGYPRYKSQSRYDSFTYPAAALEGVEGLDKAPGWSLKNNKLALSMGRLAEPIGPIKIKLHREAYGKVRTLNIVRKSAGHWYACFSVIQEKTISNDPSQLEMPPDAVGVALGLENFATLSTGEVIGNPRFHHKSVAQLAKTQQKFSNKLDAKKKNKVKETKDNCRNLKKARQAVAKIRMRVANQRQDFLHKVSRRLVDQFNTIVLPDLEIKSLVQRSAPVLDGEKSQAYGVLVYAPNNNTLETEFRKAILNAGWGQFILYTSYKAAEAGKECIKVKAHNTSQSCCVCAWISDNPLPPAIRKFVCGRCGLNLDRNWNTAINLLKNQFGASCAVIVALTEQLKAQKMLL